MDKLDQLKKSLEEYKARLEKNAQMGYGAQSGIESGAGQVNTATVAKEDMKPAPEGSKNRETYKEEFGKEEHKDEKEDKKMIAEAMDEHNEKKHGEDKDKDSAYKDMKVKKEEMVKFGANGQWSIDKAEDKFGVTASDRSLEPKATGKQPPKGSEHGEVKVTDYKKK